MAGRRRRLDTLVVLHSPESTSEESASDSEVVDTTVAPRGREGCPTEAPGASNHEQALADLSILEDGSGWWQQAAQSPEAVVPRDVLVVRGEHLAVPATADNSEEEVAFLPESRGESLYQDAEARYDIALPP